MAGKKLSKNNPTNKQSSKMKMVTSYDCENCKEQCSKGLEYLRIFQIKKQGNGVPCFK